MRTTVMRRWSARTLRSVRAVVGGDGGSCRTPVPFRVRLCGGGDRARARAPPAASWGWQRGLADSAFTPRDVGLLADELNERYSAGAEEGIVRTWLVTHIFKSYAKDRALRFLREERMTSRQLTNLIGQLGELGKGGMQKVEWVMEWATQQPGLMGLEHYDQILALYKKRADHKGALATWDQLRAAGFKPRQTTYTQLIGTLAKARHWRRAEAMMEEMSARIPDARVSVKTFNAMMSAYGNGGQWAKAEPLLARMRAAGVKPDAFTYNALIAALGAGGQWKRAEAVMGAMWKEQVPRDERTYTELIRAYGNDGQWEWAEAAFQVMKKEEVHPNALTYTALVAAYGKGGQWDLAEGAIDAMKKMNLRPEDTPGTRNAIVEAYAEGGQWARVEKLLQAVPDPNKPEWKTRKSRLTVACYGALATAYGNAGEWEKAADMPHRMLREGKKPNTEVFNTLMAVAAKHAQWGQAEAAMDSMRALGVKPNRQTFNTLIAAYGHGQQWERAEAMLRDEAWQATGLERDARSYNALIAACERADTPQWQRAETAMEAMWASGVQPTVETYSALIGCYGVGGEWERAVATLQVMKEQGLSPCLAAYDPLIHRLWTAGEKSLAQQCFTDAADAGVFPDVTKRLDDMDVREYSAGAALAALSLWLDAVADVARRRPERLPEQVVIEIGWGKHPRVLEMTKAVAAFLSEHDVPFHPTTTPSLLAASRDALVAWLPLHH